MGQRYFLDANVLVPARLRDVVLTIALAAPVEVHWSHEVLDEVKRNLPQSMNASSVAALLGQLEVAFPNANIGNVSHTPSGAGHAHINIKDRHVVIGAWRCQASLLVTDDQNLRREVRSSCSRWLSAISSDVFLASQFAGDVPHVRASVVSMVEHRWQMLDVGERSSEEVFDLWLRRHQLTRAAEAFSASGWG